MKKNPSYLSDRKMMLRAVGDAFAKLDPRVQIKNPVMFLVYVSAILTSILFVCALFGVKDAGLSAAFILAIAGMDEVTNLRVFMTSLRKKLCANSKGEKYIQTHIGVGYRMIQIPNEEFNSGD